ncbi:CDP-glucose 4,6-dehydratase [Planktothricoides sp. SR001]|uniref:CDP-glucose 4,6-dehydratase n=1 Tax=Planktothricoides sp. SR001 TaxID=1705388 RepID=UPI0006C18AF1|nr:CDP-glucose 4,6-dehydratase [Planktothricoides sp. SR001]KOR36674.1 CDP-glucose 4,6-dehydratase [Planktothricoides sp. SR001]
MLETFSNKSILITGNTGFKGSWLTAWLLHHGAKVIGLSKDIPSHPSHFEAANMGDRITHIWGNIENLATCQELIQQYQPDFIFHLAAQPLVRQSYREPHTTFTTNVVGTLNILEALRLSNHPCTAILITSDKCYDNLEQVWGYRETDRLGGKDPYSGSKGAAELVIRSYTASYFSSGDSPVKVAVGRAGNVIGGGDWACDRIVPDTIKAWSSDQPVLIRNPHATRPWQHVLEPLSGYLTLAAKLANNSLLNGETFNFGPSAEQNYTVANLLNSMQQHWTNAAWTDCSNPESLYEAGLLKLCCDKALHYLGWKPILTFKETVALTTQWYQAYYSDSREVWQVTQEQIACYETYAQERQAVWTISCASPATS